MTKQVLAKLVLSEEGRLEFDNNSQAFDPLVYVHNTLYRDGDVYHVMKGQPTRIHKGAIWNFRAMQLSEAERRGARLCHSCLRSMDNAEIALYVLRRWLQPVV